MRAISTVSHLEIGLLTGESCVECIGNTTRKHSTW